MEIQNLVSVNPGAEVGGGVAGGAVGAEVVFTSSQFLLPLRSLPYIITVSLDMKCLLDSMLV